MQPCYRYVYKWRKCTYLWRSHWKLFESPLLLWIAETETPGRRGSISGTIHLANLKYFTLNPCVTFTLQPFFFFFSGMLLPHLGKENSGLSLPQDLDTTGLNSRHWSALCPWFGAGWWKLLNCSLADALPAWWLDAKIAIWQAKARQAAGYCSESEQHAWGQPLVPDPPMQLAESFRLFLALFPSHLVVGFALARVISSRLSYLGLSCSSWLE